MTRYYCVDSVAAETHQREYQPGNETLESSPSCRELAEYDDRTYCCGDNFVNDGGEPWHGERELLSPQGTHIMWGDTDGRWHWWGIVYNPQDDNDALMWARILLEADGNTEKMRTIMGLLSD